MSARVRLLTACIIAIAALRAPCVGAQAPRPPWFHGLSLERATAVALDSISNMLASGRLATADSLAAQLLSSARERRGARSLEMLAALDTVIRVFYAKSYYGPARRYSDRFVSLGEQLLGHDAVSLAPGFSRHSDLCGHVSDFAGARSYAERAVTLAERAPAHDRLELANYIDQLAAISRARKALSEGFSSFASASSCFSSNWGSVTGKESTRAAASGSAGTETPIRRNSSSLASFSACWERSSATSD